MNKNSGFTLIEVLLALSIIGMAMLAAVQTTESTTRNLRYLQERTMAQWVAQNAMVAMRLQLNGLRPVAGRWQSTTELAGQTWFWQAYSNPTIEPSITQVTIEVLAKENTPPIITLLTYWSTDELAR